jgi:hypothetical protein
MWLERLTPFLRFVVDNVLGVLIQYIVSSIIEYFLKLVNDWKKRRARKKKKLIPSKLSYLRLVYHKRNLRQNKKKIAG